MLTNAEAKSYLAANVLRLLADRGMSQNQLAARSGLAVMTVSNIVNEKNVTSVAAAARIAEVFDVSMDRLLGPPPEKKVPDLA